MIIFIVEMADVSNKAVNSDLLEARKQLEVLDKNYRNLKGLSQRGMGVFSLRAF